MRMTAVPTTLSAAEFTSSAGITDVQLKVKLSFSHPRMAPIAVILDPAATLETPMELMLSTGMRAMDHAVERWCSVRPHPLGDGLALQAMAMLAANLPAIKARPYDLDPRLNCQLAAWLTQVSAIPGVPNGASHGIGYILGAYAGVPHGITSCISLAATLEWNEPVNAERQRAWEASKEDSTRRRQRKSDGGSRGAAATIAELVVENQHGDPRYLDQARNALADQRKLWGLDAPQKVDLRANHNACHPKDSITKVTTETFGGIREIRMLACEPQFARTFARSAGPRVARKADAASESRADSESAAVVGGTGISNTASRHSSARGNPMPRIVGEPDTHREQNGDHGAVPGGAGDVALDQPPVVHDAANRRDVYQPVDEVPALAAQAPDPAGRGSEGQRNHQDKRREPHGDERPLHDVGDDLVGGKELIEYEVGQKVQRAVEEREQPQHAAEADQGIPTRPLPQGRDRQRQRQKPQRPRAGLVGDRVDRVSAQRVRERAVDQVPERSEGSNEHPDLQESQDAYASRQSSNPQSAICNLQFF
jgi:hypothetical protein